MDSSAVTPEPVAPGADSALGLVIGAFVAPTRTFTAIARRPTWVTPLLIATVLSLLATTVLLPRMDFEASLQRAGRHADGGNAALPDARVRVEETPAMLEDELMELADTQMRTQLATRALKEHFGLMRTAITGRSA